MIDSSESRLAALDFGGLPDKGQEHARPAEVLSGPQFAED
jgi:hypothetical protein